MGGAAAAVCGRDEARKRYSSKLAADATIKAKMSTPTNLFVIYLLGPAAI
jgi:hypothetical protein